jgi:hypothetical protein
MLLLVAFFSYAFDVLRVALLPLSAALLLEELTYGGLVRLLLAPRPETGSCEAHGAKAQAPARRRREPKKQAKTQDRGVKCSR